MVEAQAGDAHLVGGQSVEHECVIGIWAVGHGNFTNWRRYGTHNFGFQNNFWLLSLGF
jgi:hypothetical protein